MRLDGSRNESGDSELPDFQRLVTGNTPGCRVPELALADVYKTREGPRVWEIYLTRRKEVEFEFGILFTKSAFLPSDFAKYVRNTRWDLRGVGHLFFLHIQNASFEKKNLRRNRLRRAALRIGVAGYIREEKKIFTLHIAHGGHGTALYAL